MSYYLKILILSTFVPVIFSFHPKVKFYIFYKSIFRATLLVSTIYILWDIIFTKLGIWGFNNQYLNGIYIFNLPMEEILFFLCIPFCCLYTYHLVEKFNISFFKNFHWEKINIYFLFVVLVVGLINYTKLYTFICFVMFSLVLFIVNKSSININFNFFYTTFILIIIPFLIINGALTGLFFDQTVVWYNNKEILGLRIFTIPIEDAFYAHQLILLNLMFYKKYSSSNTKI
tara:strand:+ start:613 stop:1302 length:690 start_codon:yes stop_codon:yes gene_type:complete